MKYKGKRFLEISGNGKEIADKYSIPVKCTNWDLFFSLCSLEDLEKILETNIKAENYEVCCQIEKHIKLKKNER